MGKEIVWPSLIYFHVYLHFYDGFIMDVKLVYESNGFGHLFHT